MFDARFVENDVSLKSNPAIQLPKPSLRFEVESCSDVWVSLFFGFHGASWLF